MNGRDLQHTPLRGDPGRLAATGASRPETDDVTSVRTVSPRSQHANLAARICGIFIQTTNGTALGLVGVGNRVLPPRIAGDRLRHVRRRSRNFLAARVEPGSQSRRDSAERYPCFVGGLHSSRMETQHGKFFPEEPT